MNKKVGIGLTIFAALVLLCCIGGIFTLKSAAAKLTEVISNDQIFVTKVLQASATTWDENEFSKFADESFNTPASREKNKKLFLTLSKNLGPLVSLSEVMPGSKSLKANTDGNGNGFFVTLTAKGKFEKGEGVFTVVVKNVKEKMTIMAISLDPVQPDTKTNPASNTP